MRPDPSQGPLPCSACLAALDQSLAAAQDIAERVYAMDANLYAAMVTAVQQTGGTAMSFLASVLDDIDAAKAGGQEVVLNYFILADVMKDFWAMTGALAMARTYYERQKDADTEAKDK